MDDREAHRSRARRGVRIVASRYKAAVRGILYATAIGSLAWSAGLVLFGDVFLSPVHLAVFVALPALV